VKKPSKRLVLASGILLVLGALGFEALRIAGVFRNVESRFPETCRAIAMAGSSEDIQVDRRRGVAYLSFLDRDSGTVLLLDLNLAEPAPRAAMSHDPPMFRPHGMSLLTPAEGPARLFVISHRPDGSHVVEIAEQQPGGAFVPTATIRDPAFVSPNAIAAVDAQRFYVVNDRPRSYGRWQQARDAFTRSGNATLVFHDGTAARVLVDDLAFPAGLALSADGTQLYVAEALGQALRIYSRDRANGALTLERRVKLDAAPDNLNVDADGRIWIAAHPRLSRFLAHVRDPAERAPTQVWRVDPRQPDATPVLVLSDDGARISAGSVAATWRDQLLIGAVLDPKVMLCRLPP
jgi:arylesterase/paraoxonase